MGKIEVYNTTSGGTVLPYSLTTGDTRGAYAAVGMIMKIVVYLLLRFARRDFVPDSNNNDNVINNDHHDNNNDR